MAFVPIANVVGPAFAIAAPFDRTIRLHRPAIFAEVPGRRRAGSGGSGDQARGRELLMCQGIPLRVRRDSGIYGYERALKRAGFDPVAGADEAGRGACAGPLVAAAVILSDAKSRQIGGLNDSKLLTALQRERLYGEITRKAVAWSVVSLEPGECDVLGMHVANVMALRMALLRLEVAPTYVLTDGFAVDGLGTPGLAVWKGDRVAACVAAASIIAKVTRDRVMCELDELYPQYAFKVHKGYCTPLHQERLDAYGPSATHRMRFVNVSRTTRVAAVMSAEDLEQYESDLELQLYREYKDVVGIFTYAVETERRFYLCNAVDLKVRTEGGDVYYEVSMSDAWVWDMYRPARFVKSAKVLTFRDVSIEEIAHSDLEVPKPT